MKPEPIVITPEPVVIKISPLGFQQYAAQFLAAARSVPLVPSFSPVPYYLYCRSLELALKAFLLANNVPMKTLKYTLRHNLEAILTDAKLSGIGQHVSITTEYASELKKANSYYSSKGFEYFQVAPALRGYRDLPNLSTLDRFASELVEKLESICLNAA